jgi:hypothetical protein
VTRPPRELRREPEPSEQLVKCARCGLVEIPLNAAETWHYVRTGEGLAKDCPKHANGWHKWEPVDLTLPPSLT